MRAPERAPEPARHIEVARPAAEAAEEVARPEAKDPAAPAPSVDEIERIKDRVARDGEREVARKTQELLVSFLDVVDDLDRAIATADALGGADRALMNGVEMVRMRFLDKLAKQGVEQDGAVGDTFDPKRHEALATAPARLPSEEGTVMAIVRPGYRIDGALLRPAGVVVGKRG